MVETGFVEVNTLADSVERRLRVAGGGGRNPTDLVALLESHNFKAVRFLPSHSPLPHRVSYR